MATNSKMIPPLYRSISHRVLLRNYLNHMNVLTDNLPHQEEGYHESPKERQNTGAYDLGDSR
jgi:hypothetical protein